MAFPQIIFPLQNPFINRSIAFKNAAQMPDLEIGLQHYLMLCEHITLAQAHTVALCVDGFPSARSVHNSQITTPFLKDNPSDCLPILKNLLNQLLKNKMLNIAARETVNLLVRYALNPKEHDFLYQEMECLMALDLDKITLEFSPFIGAALQVFYGLKAHQLGLQAQSLHHVAFDKEACPCCGMPAIASVIDSAYGVRYLHCGVCETKWHLAETDCHECDESKAVERVSLAQATFVIKAEKCDACMTYLKWLDLRSNKKADVFVEDVLSRALDGALYAQQYFSYAQNFYMLRQSVAQS